MDDILYAYVYLNPNEDPKVFDNKDNDITSKCLQISILPGKKGIALMHTGKIDRTSMQLITYELPITTIVGTWIGKK